MLKSLERAVLSVEHRLVLLAPEGPVPSRMRRVVVDPTHHQSLVRAMQRLRGTIYLHDGALRAGQLSPEGLHKTPEDERSWHLLIVNREGAITGCAWYLEHPNTITAQQLRIRHCPLATTDQWQAKLWKAVELDLARARASNLAYAEVGGWAVAEESRCTSEGLLLALAGYSLGRICGGALGLTTATVRHCSSSILRRIGGARLEVDGATIPGYYDPRYDCEMEILRFDSRKPNAKFAGLIELLCEKLSHVPVIAKSSYAPPLAVPALKVWTRAMPGTLTGGRGTVAAMAS